MLETPQVASLAVGPSRLLLYNDLAAPHYGPRHPGVLGRPLAEGFADQWPILAGFYDRVFAGEAVRVEAQPVDSSGTGAPDAYDASLAPLRGPDGAVLAAFCTFTSTGDRTRAEAALRESEARYQALFTPSDEGFGVIQVVRDAEGRPADFRHLRVNHALERLTGLRPETVLGHLISDFLPREEADWWIALYGDVLTSGRPRHVERFVPSLDRWLKVSGIPFGPGQVAAIFEDITATKRREIALRESEERIRLAIAATGLGTFDWDIASDRVAVNARFREIVGLPAQGDVIASAMMGGVVHLDDQERVAARIAAAMDPASSGTYEFEHRAVTPQGPRWLLTSGQVHFAGEGEGRRAVRIVGNDLDITERKMTEAALRESEARKGFLLRLSDILQRLEEPKDIKRVAMRLLGEHLGVSRAQYHEVDESGEYYDADGIGYADGLPLLDLRYCIGQFGSFVAEDFEGCPFRSDDLQRDPRPTPDERAAYARYGIRAGAGIPLLRGGKLVAILAVHDLNPHPWSDLEMELIRETAERVWVTVERVRTDHALRALQERQAFLLKLSDAVRPLADPADIQGETTRLLRDKLVAGWCYYVDWGLGRKLGVVLRDSARTGLPSLAGAHDVSDAPEFLELLAAGAVLTVGDYAGYEALPLRIRQQFTGLGFRSMMVAPLVKEGRLIATLLVGDTQVRDWTTGEVSLLIEVAERTWAALERGRAEAALRKSEGKYRALFESMDEAYAVVEVLKDGDGSWTDFRFIDVNPAFMKHTSMPYPVGKTAAELLGSPNPRWSELYGQVLDTGEPLRLEETEPTLARIFDLNIFALDRERNRVAVLFTDVTARRQTEKALRASEERLRQFGEASQDVLWIRDAGTLQWEYLTPAFETIYGLSREEALTGDTYRSWLDLILPETATMPSR